MRDKTQPDVRTANKIEIERMDIVSADTDCIVNAANKHLAEGGGVCGAIFRAAGRNVLSSECNAIGHCDAGNAVITQGYHLKAKYIIHAVGPRWHSGESNEEELLYSCYRKSLELAKNNDCHSITFPLISAGIFGYPKEKAWEMALRSCSDFLQKYSTYGMAIIFAVRDESIYQIGVEKLKVQYALCPPVPITYGKHSKGMDQLYCKERPDQRID